MSGSSQWAAPIQYGRLLFNTFFHQGIAVIMMYFIWVPAEYYSTPFSWHVILCSFGFIPLMAEALILFGGDNVWTQNAERKNKVIIHGVLMTISSVLIIAGVAIEVAREKQTAHFESSHAITGLISLIFLGISLVLGLMAQFSKQLSGYIKPVVLKFVHNIVANIAYVIGIASLCLGYYTPWFEYYTSAKSRDAATAATALLCVWSTIYSVISAVKQFRSIINIYWPHEIPVETIGVNRPKSFILLEQGVKDVEKEHL